MVEEDPVFAGHLNEVGGNAQSHQVQTVVGAHGREAEAFGQGLCQLERHTAAAQFLEREGAARLLGVEDGVRIGHGGARQMVVTDDHIEAHRLGLCHAFYRADAAVQGDDDAASRFCCSPDAFFGQPVPFIVAVGDVGEDVEPVVAQEFLNEGDRCGPIDVVVPIGHDALSFALGLHQPVYGLLHSEHRIRVVQLVQLRGEKGLGFRALDAAQLEQTRNQFTGIDVAQLLPASFAGRPIGWRNVRLTGHGQWNAVPPGGRGTSPKTARNRTGLP